MAWNDNIVYDNFVLENKFKDILENCLAYCIEKPEENTKEKLLKFIEPFK